MTAIQGLDGYWRAYSLKDGRLIGGGKTCWQAVSCGAAVIWHKATQ